MWALNWEWLTQNLTIWATKMSHSVSERWKGPTIDTKSNYLGDNEVSPRWERRCRGRGNMRNLLVCILTRALTKIMLKLMLLNVEGQGGLRKILLSFESCDCNVWISFCNTQAKIDLISSSSYYQWSKIEHFTLGVAFLLPKQLDSVSVVTSHIPGPQVQTQKPPSWMTSTGLRFKFTLPGCSIVAAQTTGFCIHCYRSRVQYCTPDTGSVLTACSIGHAKNDLLSYETSSVLFAPLRRFV